MLSNESRMEIGHRVQLVIEGWLLRSESVSITDVREKILDALEKCIQEKASIKEKWSGGGEA